VNFFCPQQKSTWFAYGRRSTCSRCGYAWYPLFIHRLASLLQASLRPRLAMVAAASPSAVGGQANEGAGTAVLSHTPQFLWLKPASAIFHGTEQLEWTTDAVDPTATLVNILLAGRDAFALATGQFPSPG
jgi:hypothetical protein